MASYCYLGDGNPDGMMIGISSTEKIGFYGTTPSAQISHITSLATTAVTTTTPYGYATSTQGDAVATCVNAILVALETLGLVASS